MKKTLLLSAVASTMIMAGGDIAPVEPVVETPAVAAAPSGWDFSGQAVVYYQTRDNGANDLFEQSSAKGDFGLQLRAVNNDVFAGIGIGGEVSALSTLNLENGVVSDGMQGTGYLTGTNDVDDVTDGGWISQLYMTYAMGNTSFKLGRQELPKALSPFAYSENWNVFKNTFDAALIVNTDLPDTVLVGAWVYGGNNNSLGAVASANNMTDFNEANGHDGVYMLTVQNKSFAGLTLTGTVYYGADYADNNLGANSGNDLTILWGDANYAFDNYYVAAQAGTFMDDDFADDSVAFGLKAGGDFGMFDASLAYTSVDDGGIDGISMVNVGGVKTPLYTQMILNQGHIRFDNDTFVVRAGMKALGGKITAAYDYTTDNANNNSDYQELDLVYKTKVFNDSTTLFAGYIYQTDESWGNGAGDSVNTVRVWGRYNF